MMRFRSVALRIFNGVKRVGVCALVSNGVPGLTACCGVKYGGTGDGVFKRALEPGSSDKDPIFLAFTDFDDERRKREEKRLLSENYLS